MTFLQNVTSKSYKVKTLFQTQQNLFQIFGFFTRYLPFSLFFLQLDQMQDAKLES